MGVKEKARELHESGFNCAQSVLGACDKYSGLDHITAMNVAGALGGGVRCGEICGAVSGGAIVLSCAFPHNDSSRPEDKTRIAAITKRYAETFKEKFGCIRCDDLKSNDCDCNELIEFCAQLAEERVANYKEEEYL